MNQFGILDSAKPFERKSLAAWINQSGAYRDFHWKGADRGIWVSSNDIDALSRRREHSEISVTIENFWCEDVGEWALGIGPMVKLIAKNCTFRGNWKLDPFTPGGNGQNTLVVVDGGSVEFINCKFMNSVNPIIVNAGSKVHFKKCLFYVNETSVIANGYPNPHPNDLYFGGTGVSRVTVDSCKTFKVGTVMKCHHRSIGRIKNTETDGELFIRDGGKIL